MTVSTVGRAPRPSSLYDVLDLILDKGLVIDAYVRVSLVGIELLTIDARVVVAGVDTYLRFAEATQRLDLRATETAGIPGVMQDLREGGAKQKTHGALEGVKQSMKEAFSGDDDEGGDGGNEREPARPRRRRETSREDSGQRRRREPPDEE